jgi:hypothetical protein
MLTKSKRKHILIWGRNGFDGDFELIIAGRVAGALKKP